MAYSTTAAYCMQRWFITHPARLLFRATGLAIVIGLSERVRTGGTGRAARRIVGSSLALVPFVLALVLPTLVGPSLAHETAAYSHDGSTGETNPDWMSKLPGTVRLSHISIPGTHDTGARSGGDSVEAQSMDIPTQLQAGIRAFDIRLGKAAGCDGLTNDLQIIHGDKPGFRFCQPDTFADVLSSVDAFLSQHGSETLVMRIKKETDDPSDDEFAQIVNQNLQALNGNRIYQGASTDPTLQSIRGKIVVLAQYGTGSVPAWPGNIRWSNLSKQDAYHAITNWDLAKKWNGAGSGQCDPGSEYPEQCNNVVDQFQKTNEVACDPRASEDCGGGSASNIFVNHLSAATGGFPYFFASGHNSPASDASRLPTLWTDGTIDTCGGASQCLPHRYYPLLECAGCEDCSIETRTCTVAFEGLNVLAMKFINSAESGWLWRTGIVMADFPGKGLISAIIGVNPRRFNHGDHDVGVIPASATGCTKPEDVVTIHMDDEDHRNANEGHGWTGGCTQDNSGTTLRFCRVDGSGFHPLFGAGVANLNYAVLRLGSSCPPGSVEFVRGFDNEDEDNQNLTVGDAWPNHQDDNTDLRFCLFRPTNDGVPPSVSSFPSFANLPFGYGVLGANNFLGESIGPESRGYLYIDDEDYHPADYLNVPPGYEGAVAQIVVTGDGGQNTALNFAKVLTGGGQCFGAPNGSSCDDGDLCTTNDECFAQVCSGSSKLCDTPAADQCHLAAVCDSSSGACVAPPVVDGTTCDDGDPCTVNDQCDGGACAGTPLCQAPDKCHVAATCDPITHACNAAPPAPDGTLCDDGDQCTDTDQCIAGVCTSTQAPVGSRCDDGNPCTTDDTCSLVSGGKLNCLPHGIAPAGTACDDHNECTTNDQCGGSGNCQPGTPVAGEPACHGNPCAVSHCFQGSCAPNQQIPNGSPCNDGNACTAGEALRQPGDMKTGGENDLCLVDHCDECQAGVCTGGTNVCAVAATPAPTATPSSSPVPTATPTVNQCSGAPNGAGCDDSDPCTTNDECLAGFCSGSPVICFAQDDCHLAGTCDPNSGACSNPTAPNGGTCDDGDPCTANDQCTAGTCAGTGTCPTATVPAGATATPNPAATTTATMAVTGSPVATSTATATAGSQTPCPERTGSTGPTCAGDCNGDGTVKVNELIIGVNIALGNASVCDCPSFDRDSNLAVSINELIAAVLSALGGCAS